MKIGVIILCRYGSSRLPGKILKELNGKVALQHTYDRLTKYFNPKNVIVATSDDPSDDRVAAYCLDNNIKFYRGALKNVAQRFHDAAAFNDFDYAFRVNGDNILIDLSIFEKAIALLRKKPFDFITNVKNRTFPKGMSVELVNVDFYSSLLPELSKSKNYQEHVTLFLYENKQGNYHYIFNTKLPKAQGIDLALDTEEDFHIISKIITLLGSKYSDYDLEDILSAYEQLER